MFYTYALKSISHNYIYVGLTNSPKRRTNQHNSGKEQTTRFYAPFNLIYLKAFNTRAEARKHEKYLKSGCGKEFLKNFIVNYAAVAELVYAHDSKSCEVSS